MAVRCYNIRAVESLGRYTLYAKIASGGMASVHFARLAGESGFARTVAVKRLHKHLARDPEFVGMFLDEARLAARVRHPNVVATLDVGSDGGELYVVMEYVHGEPLSRLIRFVAGEVERIPFDVVSAIMTNVLVGLHAAHEIRDKHGAPLELVHRDISPQNILVGADGITRIIDFGVAKARGRSMTTQDGKVKGKLGYMAPEQLRGERIDRRTDIYAAGVVLWELLTLVRLFVTKDDATTIENLLSRRVEPPSAFAADVPPALDEVVMRALARNPADRFDTAKQMASALEAAMPVATQAKVAEWVEHTARAALYKRAQTLADIERATVVMAPGDLFEPESMATPITHARRRRAIGWLTACVVIAIAIVSAGAVALHHHAAPRDNAAAPTSSAAITAITTISASAPALPHASAPPSAPPAASHRAVAQPKSNPCETPYTIGADGIRHYKLDCLR
jgi:serine/threonine-protein kinase